MKEARGRQIGKHTLAHLHTKAHTFEYHLGICAVRDQTQNLMLEIPTFYPLSHFLGYSKQLSGRKMFKIMLYGIISRWKQKTLCFQEKILLKIIYFSTPFGQKSNLSMLYYNGERSNIKRRKQQPKKFRIFFQGLESAGRTP